MLERIDSNDTLKKKKRRMVTAAGETFTQLSEIYQFHLIITYRFMTKLQGT